MRDIEDVYLKRFAAVHEDAINETGGRNPLIPTARIGTRAATLFSRQAAAQVRRHYIMTPEILEVAPGCWRWFLFDDTGRMLASSAMFSDPVACWRTIAMIASTPARLH